MPYLLAWEERGFLVELLGTPSIDDSNAVIAEIIGDPRYARARYAIWDSTGITPFTLADADLEHFGAPNLGVAPGKEGLLIAHVMPDKGRRKIAMRHFSRNAPHDGTRVHRFFAHVVDARRWIDAMLKPPGP